MNPRICVGCFLIALGQVSGPAAADPDPHPLPLSRPLTPPTPGEGNAAQPFPRLSPSSPGVGGREGAGEEGRGGEGSSVRLTLAEALERARVSSPRLESLTALEAAAEAARRGALAERLPLVDLSGGYTRNSNVDEFSLTLPGLGTRTIFPNIPNNYRLHAGASLPLYTGGRIEGAIAASERQREAAAQDRSGAVNDLLLETQAAYWGLVTARESARVLAEAETAFEAHLKDAKNRFDVGVAASNEVLAVQVERDRAELARLQAENSAAVVNENLIRLVGLPPGSRVEPAESLAPPPAVSADTEALVTAALAARPEILALLARAKAARASVEIQKSINRPQASLSLGYDFADPNPRILPPQDELRSSWSAGVVVAVRAFDGGRGAAAVAQASAQADALDRQVDDLKARLRLEVTSRLLDLASARAALAVTARNLDAAKENVRVARDRYTEGVVPSTELLDAETALLRAGLDQTSASTQVRIALANVDRAVGRSGK